MVYRSTNKNMELKNKKGIFFLALTMVLITILMTSYTFHTMIQERKATQKRVETMNVFVNSIQQDIERKIFIAGFRLIFSLENKIIETGSYIQSVNSSFQEMFFNGSYNLQNEPIMVGATFNDIRSDLQDIGEKINLNVSISNPKLNIDQINPWQIRVVLNTQFSVNDKGNLASWNSSLATTSMIPIYYFDDPIYTLNTRGIIAPKINKTIYISFDSSSLLDHTTKRYYKQSTQAPSFIDRLEGSISANNLNGIESLINIPQLQAQGFQIEQKSIVDHIYFSSSSPSFCHVNGMPSWFYLDDTRIASYDATCG